MGLRIVLLLAASLFSGGCASPGRLYVQGHPGLAPEHRAILLSGRIPAGTAVAGMTREEVRLAMGRDPAQFSKDNGLDAWIFGEGTAGPSLPAGDNRDVRTRDSGGMGTFAGTATAPGTERSQDATFEKSTSRTTVFFQGNRAVRAEVE